MPATFFSSLLIISKTSSYRSIKEPQSNQSIFFMLRNMPFFSFFRCTFILDGTTTGSLWLLLLASHDFFNGCSMYFYIILSNWFYAFFFISWIALELFFMPFIIFPFSLVLDALNRTPSRSAQYISSQQFRFFFLLSTSWILSCCPVFI